MPSSFYKWKRWVAGIDWLGITRVLVIQVVILVVLALAVIRYLSWNSDMAQAEFAREFGQAAGENKPMAMQEMAAAKSSTSQNGTTGCIKQRGKAVQARAIKSKEM